MGTDIHIAVEYRRDEEWKLARPPKGFWGYGWYTPRRYDAFSILANVRNGYGFAGVPTGEGFHPISEPRGLPNDMSPELRGELGSYDEEAHWLGDHSLSWLTVKEILDYDYTQMTTKCGVVDAQVYQKSSRGKPVGKYSGAVDGRNVENITNDEMDRRIATNTLTGHEYTKVWWQETYEKAMGGYLDFFRILPELIGVWESQNVRIVFGFDN